MSQSLDDVRIIVEGSTGSGKTTLIEIITTALREHGIDYGDDTVRYDISDFDAQVEALANRTGSITVYERRVGKRNGN